jgi:hypothetical protein
VTKKVVGVFVRFSPFRVTGSLFYVLGQSWGGILYGTFEISK